MNRKLNIMMNPFVFAANGLALYLGHEYALDPDTARCRESLGELHSLWRENQKCSRGSPFIPWRKEWYALGRTTLKLYHPIQDGHMGFQVGEAFDISLNHNLMGEVASVSLKNGEHGWGVQTFDVNRIFLLNFREEETWFSQFWDIDAEVFDGRIFQYLSEVESQQAVTNEKKEMARFLRNTISIEQLA